MLSPGFFRRLAFLTAFFAYLQIALGGVVRVTDSGLGCPDWPLCNGRPYPAPDIHSIIEYSHRSVGTVTGVLLILTVIAAWIVFRKTRPLVAWLATGFLVATAVMSLPESPGVGDSMLRRLATSGAVVTFLLLLTGSSVVASEADETCHAWPLCGSGFAFDFAGASAYTMLHRGSVLVIGVFLVYVLMRAMREAPTRRVAVATLVVFGLQVAVGAGSALTDNALFNGLHVAIATLVWSGVLLIGLLILPRSDRAAALSRLAVDKRPA